MVQGMSLRVFQGSFTALVTPMRDDGGVDEDALTRLVDWQIAQGTNGLVPTGTTGESPTLTHREHNRVVELVVAAAAGRVPVMAGTGSNSTQEAIEMTGHAKQAGADAALVVTPYYNKPSQEGMFLHYTAIADAVDLPLFIYNIPGRSVVDMSVETMARLAKHPRIAGVKDATADLARPLRIRQACGSEFLQFSGEDPTATSFLAAGGVGCISVTANIAPKLCAQMHAAWRRGDIDQAIALQDKLFPLHEAMFSETNPVPVKYAASLLGFGTGNCRLPMSPCTDAAKAQVQAAMQALSLLDR